MGALDKTKFDEFASKNKLDIKNYTLKSLKQNEIFSEGIIKRIFLTDDNQIDLIISVDTSVAHLAGALAKKVWILLNFIPDFRWMLDREDSPWYPNARLFRQPKIDDWNSVIKKIEKELKNIKF